MPAPDTARLDSPLARGRAPDPLFADNSVLAVRLEGPLRALARDSDEKPEERPALLSWRDANGEDASLEIEIRPRGKSRRRREVCQFPPIRLDIPRSRAEGTLFENQDKLKLVTHCVGLGSRSRKAPDWVALEFLAYRILNLVTDYSFRVRPLSVTYVDEKGRDNVHPAFIIEADDRLAVRLGLERSELPTVAAAAFAENIAPVMELFEYLIGNTDFSFVSGPPDEACCHNAVQFTNGTRFTPIPYDFDLTGLVDKPDALPADGLGLRKVTQRRFRGFCRDAATLERAIDLFVARRAAIEAEIAAPLLPLSARGRRHAQRFVEGFYATVLDPEAVARNISGRCRG
ncbi:MAG TPA: hypothetical protein VLA56_18245 [Pseudomonadales bacterium]|nr:hypothetical protein [Pseudomonadales bacterium]